MPMQVEPNKLLPTFRDYRRRNDPVMVPDRGFTRQLKCLDPEFDVVWDWGSHNWQIWRFPKDDQKEECHILTVQTTDKTYRELGADILLRLQVGRQLLDLSLNQLTNYFDEMDNQVERRKAHDFKNKVESITKETQQYARGVLQLQVPKKFKIARVVSNDT